jgi:hypothetical protein
MGRCRRGGLSEGRSVASIVCSASQPQRALTAKVTPAAAAIKVPSRQRKRQPSSR